MAISSRGSVAVLRILTVVSSFDSPDSSDLGVYGDATLLRAPTGPRPNLPSIHKSANLIIRILTDKCEFPEVVNERDSLIDFAYRQNALTTLHGRILPSTDLNSQTIATLLKAVHTLNTERNQTALKQIHELTVALNTARIQPVALKGLANILTGIYPDLGTRYLADLDLLIPKNQFPAAIAVFQSLDYATLPAHPVELAIGHTYPPFHRSGSLEVDLHRTLGLHPCPNFLPAEDFIREATVHNVNGTEILIPSPTHLVTHHIMHSQMHDVYKERLSPSLRTLYDFYLLNRHFGDKIDWEAIESHFRRKGQYATLVLYLLEAEATLEIVPPIRLQLTPASRVRRCRRELLQKYPGLRWIDPAYYMRAGIEPRTRRLRDILAHPKGVEYLLQKFRRPEFYARIRSDFR